VLFRSVFRNLLSVNRDIQESQEIQTDEISTGNVEFKVFAKQKRSL